MIEEIVEEKLKELFFPFESEQQLVTTMETNFDKLTVVKQETYRDWKVVVLLDRYNRSGYVRGLALIFNESERKLTVAYQLGELDFPRIKTIHYNTEPSREMNECLEFLYGNGENIIYLYGLSTKKPKNMRNFEQIKKNPMFWFLLKSLRKATNPVINNWSNFNKAKVILSSLSEAYLNIYARDRVFEDMKAKDYLSLYKSIIKEIFFEAFVPKDCAPQIRLTKAMKQRSMFIGFYIYPLLMNKIQYDKDIWFSFFEEIKYAFKEEVQEIIQEIKEDLENNRVPEELKKLSTAKKIDFEEVYKTILISEELVNRYGDLIFEEDSYLEQDSKKILKNFEKEIEEISLLIQEKLNIFNFELIEEKEEEEEWVLS